MLTRALTGTVFVAVLIFSSYLSPFSLFGLYFIFVLIGTWEYLSILSKNSDFQPNITLGLILSAFTFLALTSKSVLGLDPDTFIGALIFSVFATPLIELYNNKPNPFSNIAQTIFPLIYVALPFGLLILSNSMFTNSSPGKFSSELILGFYFILWSNDTGAYLTGKAFGKHKLFERISPNKTWEGSIGGAVLAIGIAIVCGMFFTDLPLWKWTSIGLIISVFGSMGDLAESLFKRSMNVKDSGKIMPGHGGILDRFDGLLIASPFVFAFLLITKDSLNLLIHKLYPW